MIAGAPVGTTPGASSRKAWLVRAVWASGCGRVRGCTRCQGGASDCGRRRLGIPRRPGFPHVRRSRRVLGGRREATPPRGTTRQSGSRPTWCRFRSCSASSVPRAPCLTRRRRPRRHRCGPHDSAGDGDPQHRWALAAGATMAFFPSLVVWSSVPLRDSTVWAITAGLGLTMMFVAVLGPREPRRSRRSRSCCTSSGTSACALCMAAVALLLQAVLGPSTTRRRRSASWPPSCARGPLGSRCRSRRHRLHRGEGRHRGPRSERRGAESALDPPDDQDADGDGEDGEDGGRSRSVANRVAT